MIFLVCLIVASTSYGETKDKYFFEWDKDITKVRRARYFLKKYKIKYNKSTWAIDLTKKQATKLLRTGAFRYLEKNSIQKIIDFNEPLSSISEKGSMWSEGWHLSRINLLEAWKQTKGSRSVIVAVCDSGIDSNNIAFKGRVLAGWNFIDDNEDTSPNTNHGTSVSGFIAATDKSKLGMPSGVAPNVSILPGKIVTTTGGVPTDAMLSCIRWAADSGAKVINVSMTGVNSASSATAARYANSKGALVVWAAGNQNYYTRWRDKKEILAVGATDIEDNRYFAQVERSDGSFKNFGSNTGYFVDIAAPGEDVYSLRIDGSFKRSNGTSYAAPIVSGVAALVYSINPRLSSKQVTRILEKSADDLGLSRSFGKGMVNAKRAVQMAKDSL